MKSKTTIPESAGLTIHKDINLCGVEKLKAMTQRELISLVKETNGKAISAAKQTLLHIGQTGVALIYLKDVTPHGTFMRSVEGLTGISQRTANNYMAIARHYGNVSTLRGVSDALRYIREASDSAKKMDERRALPCKLPAPAPAIEAEIVTPSPLHRAPAPAVTVEAEIVEPVTAPAGEPEVPEDHDEVDEPAALVVDGIKEAHQPEVADTTKPDIETDGKEEEIGKYTPRFGNNMAILARCTLDRVLDQDEHFQRSMDETISYCVTRICKTAKKGKGRIAQIDMTNGEGGFPAVIAAMLPHLSKDELSKVMGAAVTRWETITGISTGGTSAR